MRDHANSGPRADSSVEPTTCHDPPQPESTRRTVNRRGEAITFGCQSTEPGNDPLASLPGDGRDPIEVRVVVKHRQAVRLRRRGDEEVGQLSAALMLGGEHALHLPCALNMFGRRLDEVKYVQRAHEPIPLSRAPSRKPISRSLIPARASSPRSLGIRSVRVLAQRRRVSTLVSTRWLSAMHRRAGRDRREPGDRARS